MPRVKVWNDNEYTHSEKYNGDLITIEPHSCVEMEWEEAIMFRGQFTPITYKGDGQTIDPRCYKMIRVDAPSEPIFKETPHIVHATGQRATSAEDLIAALKEYGSARPDLQVREKDSPDSAGRMAQLEEKVAELTALISSTIKRGPGRPRKEVG